MRKTYKGMMEYSFSLYLLILVIVMILYVFRMELLAAVRRQSEDSLVSANLAAAVIDMELYDEESAAVISDAGDAYAHYLKALRENLELGDDMMPENSYLIRSGVAVECFEIYNVFEDDVEKLSVADGGICERAVFEGGRGKIKTPNGKIVEYTTVYSRIGFEIEAVFGQTVYVTKDGCVDIAADPAKEEEDEEKENL